MLPGLVMPLIISAGGVVDQTFYKFLKKVFPDGDQRRRLLLDMDVVLARGRGQIYSRATVVARLVFMRLVSIAVRGLGPGQLSNSNTRVHPPLSHLHLFQMFRERIVRKDRINHSLCRIALLLLVSYLAIPT